MVDIYGREEGGIIVEMENLHQGDEAVPRVPPEGIRRKFGLQ